MNRNKVAILQCPLDLQNLIRHLSLVLLHGEPQRVGVPAKAGIVVAKAKIYILLSGLSHVSGRAETQESL